MLFCLENNLLPITYYKITAACQKNLYVFKAGFAKTKLFMRLTNQRMFLR